MSIKSNELLSPQLAYSIKRALTSVDYKEISKSHGMSPVTCRMIVYRQSPVTDGTLAMANSLFKRALQNANSLGMSLQKFADEQN